MRANNNNPRAALDTTDFPIFRKRQKETTRNDVVKFFKSLVCYGLCCVLSLCIARLYFLSFLLGCLVFLHISYTIDARRRVVRRILTSLVDLIYTNIFSNSDFSRRLGNLSREPRVDLWKKGGKLRRRGHKFFGRRGIFQNSKSVSLPPRVRPVFRRFLLLYSGGYQF